MFCVQLCAPICAYSRFHRLIDVLKSCIDIDIGIKLEVCSCALYASVAFIFHAYALCHRLIDVPKTYMQRHGNWEQLGGVCVCVCVCVCAWVLNAYIHVCK